MSDGEKMITAIPVRRIDGLVEGEIAVCLPGFNTDNRSGGAGYKDGMMKKLKETNMYDSESFIHWGFQNNNGVFARALRKANDFEEKCFNEGITDIHDIVAKFHFKISYYTVSGETKTSEIESFSEQEAISSIKDLKSINYVISST